MGKNGYLQKRKMLKAEIQALVDTEKETALDIACRIALVTMNEQFGIGRERAEKFWEAFENNVAQYAEKAEEIGGDYAQEWLDALVEQVLGKGKEIHIHAKL